MAQRRSGPKSRGKGYRQRAINQREIRQRFLIVCEGKKTEPNYFRKFRVPGLVLDIHGLGLDPKNLVNEAVARRTDGEYDQVWCVFDRDSWTVDDFNGALSSARERDIQVAWSNEAFELWYLLHFNYHDTAIPRAEYITRLDKVLGHTYAKNSTEIYDELATRMGTALKNAAMLLAQYDPPNPATDNPATTVHLLVEELRRFSR
ncbi:MAG: RloB domain-containing protein [Chloroflexi bacterium]|nr:MAG: RloB domain-containing protein [Chloroflexota bacterium]